jgi:Tol biopolymer transport system component
MRASPSRRWVAAAAVGFTALVILGAVAMQRRGAPPLPALDRMTRLTNTGGLEVHPALSPDGRYVAYTHLTATGAEIFLQPVDGGRAINVTDSAPGFQVGPDWSPDGTRLVFMEADSGGMSIQTMPPTGGSPRTLRRYRGFAYLVPRWSPDGRLIAFTENDSILVMNPDGSGVRLVARLAAAHSLPGRRTGNGWRECARTATSPTRSATSATSRRQPSSSCRLRVRHRRQ